MRTAVEGGTGDGVGELTVWRLLIYKVQLLSCDVNYICFLDNQTAAGARNFFGRLIRNRFYVHHHHLHTRAALMDPPHIWAHGPITGPTCDSEKLGGSWKSDSTTSKESANTSVPRWR